MLHNPINWNTKTTTLVPSTSKIPYLSWLGRKTTSIFRNPSAASWFHTSVEQVHSSRCSVVSHLLRWITLACVPNPFGHAWWKVLYIYKVHLQNTSSCKTRHTATRNNLSFIFLRWEMLQYSAKKPQKRLRMSWCLLNTGRKNGHISLNEWRFISAEAFQSQMMNGSPPVTHQL